MNEKYDAEALSGIAARALQLLVDDLRDQISTSTLTDEADIQRLAHTVLTVTETMTDILDTCGAAAANLRYAARALAESQENTERAPGGYTPSDLPEGADPALYTFESVRQSLATLQESLDDAGSELYELRPRVRSMRAHTHGTDDL